MNNLKKLVIKLNKKIEVCSICVTEEFFFDETSLNVFLPKSWSADWLFALDQLRSVACGLILNLLTFKYLELAVMTGDVLYL